MTAQEEQRYDHELPPGPTDQEQQELDMLAAANVAEAKRVQQNAAHSFTEGSDVLLEEGEPRLRTEAQKLKDAQDAKAWLANPENRQKALLLAQQVATIMGKNWFSLQAFLKKTREDCGVRFWQVVLVGAVRPSGPERRRQAGHVVPDHLVGSRPVVRITLV